MSLGGELFPINEGSVFSISFKHSVNQSTVTEIFQARQGQILLTALEFEAFGAGMPAYLQEGERLVYLPCGAMRIEGMESVFDSILFSIGYGTEHMFHMDGRKIPLQQGQLLLQIIN